MKKISLMLFSAAAVLFLVSADANLLEHWRNTMKFGVSSQRLGVIKTVEDRKVKEAYDLIEQALLTDPNPEIRGSAAYALIGLKIDNESIWNKALTSETDPEVLRKTVFAVSELKIRTTGPRLHAILTNNLDNPKSSYLCAAAIRAIGTVEYQGATGTILGLLTNLETPAEIRSASAIAVGELGSSKHLPLLKSILDNVGEATDVRMYSAYAIGKSGDNQALDILTPYIENEREDLNIRLWGIAGLAFVKSARVPDMLIRYAKVDNIRIRLEAVKALGKLKSESAKDILKYKAIYDPDLSVKREAKTALQEMGVDVDKLQAEASKPAQPSPPAAAPSAAPKPAATETRKESPAPSTNQAGQ